MRNVNVGISAAIRAGLLGEVRLRKRFGAEIPLADWTPAVRLLHEQPVLARIDHVVHSLKSAKGSDDVLVCDALCEHVATFRDGSLDSLHQRRDFVSYVRQEAWPVLQRLALARISEAQARGDVALSQGLEKKLLLWAEQFENRLLVEELRLAPVVSRKRTSPFSASWDTGAWGFRSPWGPRELEKWSEDAIVRWLHARDSQCLGCCTSSGGAISPPGGECATEVRFRFEPAPGVRPLAELVPVGCVWIRALFDAQERLLWWAWRNEAGALRRLAFGTSAPGAKSRLESANRAFDAATDAAWAQFRSSPVRSEIASLKAFREFTQYLAAASSSVDSSTTPEVRAGFVERMTNELARLSALLPTAAECGKQLLQWQVRPVTERGAFPEAAWLYWNADIQRRRQIELEWASQTQLSALGAEWDLTPLWQHIPEDGGWAAIDVLFQVPGPLLVMPYAWLDFGGRPLFEHVASTGTAVSLTLRDASARRCGERVVPMPALLLAQWLEAPERPQAHGLPLLHAGLRRLAADSDWTVRTLGDDPEASVSNLCQALREDFGLVVIGAHGDPSRAGVALSGRELWCGDGTDLSAVDLLILCCCAVGRLTQRGGRDVEGLYSRLAVNGARCVVAARWTIDDIEAAIVLGEFAREYLTGLRNNGVIGLFDRARAWNRARRTVLHSRHPELSVSAHLVAAFELFGVG